MKTFIYIILYVLGTNTQTDDSIFFKPTQRVISSPASEKMEDIFLIPTQITANTEIFNEPTQKVENNQNPGTKENEEVESQLEAIFETETVKCSVETDGRPSNPLVNVFKKIEEDASVAESSAVKCKSINKSKGGKGKSNMKKTSRKREVKKEGSKENVNAKLNTCNKTKGIKINSDKDLESMNSMVRENGDEGSLTVNGRKVLDVSVKKTTQQKHSGISDEEVTITISRKTSSECSEGISDNKMKEKRGTRSGKARPGQKRNCASVAGENLQTANNGSLRNNTVIQCKALKEEQVYESKSEETNTVSIRSVKSKIADKSVVPLKKRRMSRANNDETLCSSDLPYMSKRKAGATDGHEIAVSNTPDIQTANTRNRRSRVVGKLNAVQQDVSRVNETLKEQVPSAVLHQTSSEETSVTSSKSFKRKGTGEHATLLKKRRPNQANDDETLSSSSSDVPQTPKRRGKALDLHETAVLSTPEVFFSITFIKLYVG